MSRDFAPLYTSIWNDPDWRALRPHQQHMYFLLMSQARVSHCGVLDWLPARLTALAEGLTRLDIDTQVASLIQADYLELDSDTSELLVRSFIRWDGLIKMERPAKAIAKDWRTIASDTIQRAVLVELRRLFGEAPKLAGWIGIGKQDPELMELVKGHPGATLRAMA